MTGKFDFDELITPLEELRRRGSRHPAGLAAAVEGVEKAKTDYRLARRQRLHRSGLDGLNVAHDPDFTPTVGVGVTIPVRIFDRNQGEKVRTELDIGRNQRLVEARELQVFSDVDSAYAALRERTSSCCGLTRPDTSNRPSRVRETISFSYQHGGASLLDFLQAQQDYRIIQLSYLDLVGSYLERRQPTESCGRT